MSDPEALRKKAEEMIKEADAADARGDWVEGNKLALQAMVLQDIADEQDATGIEEDVSSETQ